MKIQRCFWMTAKPPVVSLHLSLFDFRQMAGSRPSTQPAKTTPTNRPTNQPNQPTETHKANPLSRGAFAIGSFVLKWHLCDAPTFDLAEWRGGRVDAGAGDHGAWIEVESPTGVWHTWAGLLQRHTVFDDEFFRWMRFFWKNEWVASGDVKMLKVGLRFFIGGHSYLKLWVCFLWWVRCVSPASNIAYRYRSPNPESRWCYKGVTYVGMMTKSDIYRIQSLCSLEGLAVGSLRLEILILSHTNQPCPSHGMLWKHPTINMEGTLLNGFCSVVDAGLRDGETISATVRCDVDHRLLTGEKSRGLWLERWKVACMFFFTLLNLVFSFLCKIPTLKRRRVYVYVYTYLCICIVYVSENCRPKSFRAQLQGPFWTTFSTNQSPVRQVRQVGGWSFVPSLYLDSGRWDGGLLGQQSGLWTVSWSAIFWGGLGGLKRGLKRLWFGKFKDTMTILGFPCS